VIEGVAGKVSGAWLFRDTRMPVSLIFENLEEGVMIEGLMKRFPVTRETSSVRSGICGLPSRCGASWQIRDSYPARHQVEV
jgi:hypothetical protein